MMYRATYHGPRNPYGEWQTETRILPTLRAVELWAATKLQGVRVETTRDCYWRDVSNAPSVTYKSVIKYRSRLQPTPNEMYHTYRWSGEILPEIIIVPSVGELGWTP